MSITCPHCGTEYEVGKDEMYRYVKCGVCGRGFVAGASNSRSAQQSIDLHAQAVMRKLQMDSDERSEAERKANAVQQKARMESAIKMSMMLFVLVACMVGGVWWHMKMQDEKRTRKAEILRQRQEAEAQEAERREKEEAARKQEKEEREAALARKRAEQEQLEKEQSRQRQEAREARERAERELREGKERYHLYMMALKENEFDMFAMSVTNDLNRSGGELCYLLPSATLPTPIYHVIYETNGMKRVFRMYDNGEKEEVGFETFQKQIDGTDYLVAKDGKVHFRSTRKNPSTGLLPMANETDPAETFFGALVPALKELRPTYDELTFDIFFTPRESAKKIFVENLPFGCFWSRRNVREAIEKNTPIRNGNSYSGGSRTKKFKRTVKLWNGMHIKRGVGGVTYVPMTPPPIRYGRTYCTPVPNCIYRSRTYYDRNSYNYEHWSALHAKALQEDAEEAAFYDRQRWEQEDRRNSARTADEQRWQEKVEDILRNGTLSYKIRKAKVEADKDK